MGNTYRAVLMYVKDGDTFGFVSTKYRARDGKRSVRREQRRAHAKQTREALRQHAIDEADDMDELLGFDLDALWDDYGMDMGGCDDHPSLYDDWDFYDDWDQSEACDDDCGSWYDDEDYSYSQPDPYNSGCSSDYYGLAALAYNDAGESLGDILGRALRSRRQDHL